MGKYIDQAVLEKALGPATVVALFTDPGSGQVDAAAIAELIDEGEGEVDSYLIGDINTSDPSFVKVDRLLRRCALDFTICFAFERHPEYVRTFGDERRGPGLYQRAKERMERVQAATQQLPDQSIVPGNVGGIILDDSTRTTITDIMGVRNGDGF